MFLTKKRIKKISKILGISPETLNKEPGQFYEDRKKELKKRIKERRDDIGKLFYVSDKDLKNF